MRKSANFCIFKIPSQQLPRESYKTGQRFKWAESKKSAILYEHARAAIQPTAIQKKLLCKKSPAKKLPSLSFSQQ